MGSSEPILKKELFVGFDQKKEVCKVVLLWGKELTQGAPNLVFIDLMCKQIVIHTLQYVLLYLSCYRLNSVPP